MCKEEGGRFLITVKTSTKSPARNRVTQTARIHARLMILSARRGPIVRGCLAATALIKPLYNGDKDVKYGRKN